MQIHSPVAHVTPRISASGSQVPPTLANIAGLRWIHPATERPTREEPHRNAAQVLLAAGDEPPRVPVPAACVEGSAHDDGAEARRLRRLVRREHVDLEPLGSQGFADGPGDPFGAAPLQSPGDQNAHRDLRAIA